jgi:peptidoglycan/xylan/chitin deacetylase (PgdA/CDA1 family)
VIANPIAAVGRRYQRRVASLVFRRPQAIQAERAIVSFSFDDFPRSALLNGGTILRRFDVFGTYYTSMGLMGQRAPTGEIFVADDLHELLRQGHELGCHTHSHCHSWQTPGEDFERSILENRAALEKEVPQATFGSFSYPICPPRPFTKRRVAAHFPCSRAGGQTFNRDGADRNQLAAFFLEKSRDRIDDVKNVIARNLADRGWLIFATHDVTERPTPFGCTPAFFEEVVLEAVRSGARILPVAAALAHIRQEAARSNRDAQSPGISL